MHLFAVNRGVLLTPFHNMALFCCAHSEEHVVSETYSHFSSKHLFLSCLNSLNTHTFNLSHILSMKFYDFFLKIIGSGETKSNFSSHSSSSSSILSFILKLLTILFAQTLLAQSC